MEEDHPEGNESHQHPQGAASTSAGTARFKGFRVETTGVALAFNGCSLRFLTEAFWEFMDLLSNTAQDLAAAQVRQRKPAVE